MKKLFGDLMYAREIVFALLQENTIHVR